MTGSTDSHRLADATSCVLLCALAILFAWPVSALGQLPSSMDFVLQYYPNLAFLARELRAGEIPLWNPTLFAGTPYLADPQSQLLYFPDWPLLLTLDIQEAARAIVVLHFALAAVATYLYLRHRRLPAVAAILGATVFGLGPYATAQVAWLPMLISMAWMPLALLFFEQALERRSLARATLAGVVLAMQFFNGWPHGSYITAFALLAVFVWQVTSETLVAPHSRGGPTCPPAGRHSLARSKGAPRPEAAAEGGRPLLSPGSWRPIAGLVGIAAATGGIALGIAAPVLLPFLEFWRLSNYASDKGVQATASEGSVTLLTLAGVGGSEGHGAYIGMLGLLLVILGVICGRERRRWLYLSLAAFGLLVAFGANAPVYGVLYNWIPGFRTFHMPGRFMVLFAFGAAVLAAMGTEALLRLPARRLAISAVGGVTAATILGAFVLVRMLGPNAPGLLASNLLRPGAGPYLNAAIAAQVAAAGAVAIAFVAFLVAARPRGTIAALLALLIVTADLLSFQGKDAYYFAQLPLALRGPSPMAEMERLAGDRDFRVAGFLQTGKSHVLSDFPFNLNGALVPPNLSLLYGVEDLQGYLPLRLRSYADYLAAANGGQDDYHWAIVRNFQSPLLDMLNLRYVMLRENEDRLTNSTIATNPAISPGRPAIVRPASVTAKALNVRSFLGNATKLQNGQVVALIRVTTDSGEVLTFQLRAGVETAEWAYDRPDVLANVLHDRAPIASTRNLPSPTHEYLGSFPFAHPVTISEVAIEQVEPSVSLTVSEVAAVPASPTERYEKAGELDGATVYRNLHALPRVLMVPKAEAVSTDEEALQRIQSQGFDPWSSVVLEGSAALSPQPAITGPADKIETVSRGANSVRLAVSGASSGFLVLNEVSYPGWKAYLDGRQVAVWRANYLFRAIEVPPGDHDIEFRFEPDSLKLGLALFLSTLAFLLAAVVALRLRSRKKRKERVLP